MTRRRPLVAAVVVALLAVAGVDGATIARRSASPHPAPAIPHATSTRSATAAAPAPRAAVDALLDQRTDALEHRDLAAFTALLDPAATAFVAAQRAEFVALAQLPLTDVSYTEDAASAAARGPVAGHGGAPTFAPTVTFTYELDGFDTTPVTATEVDTFVQRGDRWLLAADSDFGSPPPQVWQDGPLHVVRGARSLVIAQAQTSSVAQAVADEVDRDVPAVSAIWGTDWPQQAVVLLPATTAELGALVGETGDLSQIAAVETSEVGIDPAGAARIAINPTPYASLSALGRQVVLTHELTHVASRDDTTSSSPLWLVEGLADDVGFSRAGLPATVVAAELRTRVLAGFVPAALPADSEFRSDATNLTSAYELSWLACRLIVSKIGEAGLVAVYREVGRPTDPGADATAAVAAALQDQLHETTAEFTREWVAFVHQQLGVTRTLVVTNDFPPRPGGIQAFVQALAVRQPPGSLVVYASDWRGSRAYDAELPFPVVRHRSGLMLPTPDVARRAARIARAEGCDTVWYGAAAPLGLLTPSLRRHGGIARSVASTHGHEVGWALAPGSRQLLRRVGQVNDVVTYLGPYTRRRLAPALGRHPRLVRLSSGVDTEAFRPGCGGAEVRARHGLTDRPVVVCVSRLVARKGQDVLVRALPLVRQAVPDAALLVVGGGPARPALERLAREHGVADHVVITGSVPWAELPAHYDAGDVFAMPCRTRRAGLEVEGLGIVFLEASATGLPVVVGDSGGSPDALVDGVTGALVEGRDVRAVADAVVGYLADPARAAAAGAAGRRWVQDRWRWDVLAGRLGAILADSPGLDDDPAYAGGLA